MPKAGCPADGGRTALYVGKTTASYFWDDGSGINGDTGAPASGEPMQKGLAASPSWPMGTKGYVIYNGKKADFFIGDRGPGIPSSNGVMLDLDGKTFAELTGGTWNTDSLTVDDVGGLGHIPVTYVIVEWGKGLGKTGAPRPFSTGAYGVEDHPKPPPPCPTASPAPSAAPVAPHDAAPGAKESTASVAPPSATADDPVSPAPADTQVSRAAGTDSGAPPAVTGAPRAAADAVKAERGTGQTATSPAFTPVSAVDGQPDEAAVPALSVTIVVCAVLAVGVKAVLSRPAHGTSHQPGRHRER